MADLLHIEWGSMAPREGYSATVIVDTLSFSTATSVAINAGAQVVPMANRPEARRLSEDHGFLYAGKRSEGEYSLSPASLATLFAGNILVLTSPNGARLSTLSREGRLFTGCLRNADVLSEFLQSVPGRVLLVAAGERWPNKSLRPAYEDILACGAIAHGLTCEKSPEMRLAEAGFVEASGDLYNRLKTCESGRELAHFGYGDDVQWAATLNADKCVPELIEGDEYNAFVDVG